MVSYKRCFYAFSIMIALLNGQFIKSSELGELQARKYISHLIDSLFIPHNHSVSYQHNLHNFSQGLTNDLTRRLGSFPYFYSFSKVYNDDQVYQEVINESLAFIEQSAQNFTIAEIQQYYYQTTGNQKAFVDKVVSLLMKEIKAKLAKTSLLPQGFFTGYFGAALTTKVHILAEKELKKESDRLEKINIRTQCPTCSFKFDTVTNKRITLSCNHSICLACLKELWSRMGSVIECNKCHSKINISDFAQEAWATPTTDYSYDTYYYVEQTDPVLDREALNTYEIDTNQTYYY